MGSALTTCGLDSNPESRRIAPACRRRQLGRTRV